ncbi:hypothetical protein EBR66_02745 [bacterium]|nr:hypothetical protein [bacterium]
MAKDYFQDITPPKGSGLSPEASPRPVEVKREVEKPVSAGLAQDTAPKTIRNVTVPPRRPRIDDGVPRFIEQENDAPPRARSIFIWALAGAAIVLCGVVGFFTFRPTVVTVVPRVHTITFPEGTRISAVSEGGTGALVYSVRTQDFEESTTVPAGASTPTETRAKGTITLVNEFSAAPVRLIKNTRFEANGLVFRIPESVMVPGKNASGPGTLSTTVVADKPGELYNIAPTARFTLPGLKSNADMYANVYARSSSAFTGGFVGNKPSVDPKALEAARADIRTRLQEKIKGTGQPSDASLLVLPGVVTFESVPEVAEGTSAKVTEKARVSYITFKREEFAQALGAVLAVDVAGSVVAFEPGKDFTVAADGVLQVGSPITLVLGGSGLMRWKVDTNVLSNALAGKAIALFQEILKTQKSVQEAHFRAPLWSSTFTTDPSRIRIDIQDVLTE